MHHQSSEDDEDDDSYCTMYLIFMDTTNPYHLDRICEYETEIIIHQHYSLLYAMHLDLNE